MIQKIHISAPDESKAVVERLTTINIEKKLESYLSRYDGDDVEGLFEVKVDKNKKWLFDGVVQVTVDGQKYRYEREDYKNLDDLVNNLFDHFKQELSDK